MAGLGKTLESPWSALAKLLQYLKEKDWQGFMALMRSPNHCCSLIFEDLRRI
jgi:hypothetical protein